MSQTPQTKLQSPFKSAPADTTVNPSLITNSPLTSTTVAAEPNSATVQPDDTAPKSPLFLQPSDDETLDQPREHDLDDDEMTRNLVRSAENEFNLRRPTRPITTTTTTTTTTSLSNGGRGRSSTPRTSSTPNATAGPSTSTPVQPNGRRPAAAQLGLSSSIPPLPHYTVERVTNNSQQNPHLIKLVKGITDAPNGKAMWPSNTKPGSRVGGKLNWHDAQDKNVGTHRLWRMNLGAAIAREMQLGQYLHLDSRNGPQPSTDGRARSSLSGSTTEYFVLDDWPENYLFTIHHSSSGSSNKDRTDPYLFGSPSTKKFRSVNEFIPHLIWLLQRSPENGLRCLCKYCNGNKLQRVVNHDLGLVGSPLSAVIKASGHSGSRASSRAENSPGPSRRASSPAYSIASTSATTNRKRKSSVDSTVEVRPNKVASKANSTHRDSPDPVQPVASTSRAGSTTSSLPGPRTVPPPPAPYHPSPVSSATVSVKKSTTANVESAKMKYPPMGPSYNGSYTNKQRDKDLGDGARFRIGELVWIQLPTPIFDRTCPEGEVSCPAITHWPALISDRGIKIDSIRDGPRLPGVGVKFRRHQLFIYSAKLLAVQDEVTQLKEDQVIAWRAYEVDRALSAREDLYLTPRALRHIIQEGKGALLRPALNQFGQDLREASTTFALALQASAHVADTFCVSDKYRLNEEHLRQSYENGKNSMSEIERKRELQQLQFWHYQQMWYGAELIWSGELVRLVCSPEAVVDPNKKILSKRVKLAPRASMRCLFLKSTGVYNGPNKLPMICGRVYELRPIPSSEASKAEAEAEAKEKEEDEAEDEFDRKQFKESYMPSPPPGYEFHLLSRWDENVHLEATWVAGRYHPLRDEWKTAEQVENAIKGVPALHDYDIAMAVDPDKTPLSAMERMLGLAGLTPGHWVTAVTRVAARNRHDAIVRAEEQGQKDLYKYLSKQADLVEVNGHEILPKVDQEDQAMIPTSAVRSTDGQQREGSNGSITGRSMTTTITTTTTIHH